MGKKKAKLPESLWYVKKFERSEVTLLLLFAVMITTFSMYYLWLRHSTDEWGIFVWDALLFVVIGFTGFVLANYTKKHKRKNDPTYKPFNASKTFDRVGIIALCLLSLQLAVGLFSRLSMTLNEQALYYVTAAVAEEVFFRGFIIRVGLRIKNTVWMGVIATIVSTVAFSFIHQSYYTNIIAMITVVGSGILLCTFFILWKDLTANVIAHFIVNLLVVFQLYIYL